MFRSDRPPGTLSIAIPEQRAEEFEALESTPIKRIWTVRAILGGEIVLTGSYVEACQTLPRTLVRLARHRQSLYVHHGQSSAVYFDLLANAEDKEKNLTGVEVRVEAELPWDAFLFARRPLNEMVDLLSLWENGLPLLIQRLELLSPRDGQILAYQLAAPFPRGLQLGEFGGVFHWPLFAPYDAILREAAANPSPFYRLLCACRVYEGTQFIRKQIRGLATQLGISEALPKDPIIKAEILSAAGFESLADKPRHAADLFKLMKKHRNGIAHFLIDGDPDQAHMYISEGDVLHEYAAGASVLLTCAATAINDLRSYYARNIERHVAQGSVIPEVKDKDWYVARAPSDTP